MFFSLSPALKRALPCGCLCALLLFGAFGCSKKEEDNKAMRDGMTKKGVTLNDVPPEQRERVKAFMKMSQPKGAPGGAAPGGTTAGSAPAPDAPK